LTPNKLKETLLAFEQAERTAKDNKWIDQVQYAQGVHDRLMAFVDVSLGSPYRAYTLKAQRESNSFHPENLQLLIFIHHLFLFHFIDKETFFDLSYALIHEDGRYPLSVYARERAEDYFTANQISDQPWYSVWHNYKPLSLNEFATRLRKELAPYRRSARRPFYALLEDYPVAKKFI
jgi:hypothetical protein